MNETMIQTPGVYINEISSFPPTVVQVETAVPVFIGYTQNSTAGLNMKPIKIFSFLDFVNIFGGENQTQIAVAVSPTAPFGIISMTITPSAFTLYYHIKMFFDNGGSMCYIVSVGDYSGTGVEIGTDTPLAGLLGGLKTVESEDEPTILVVPEATSLANNGNYQSLVQAMLKQCFDLQDRFAIFDVFGGTVYDDTIITQHRTNVGADNLNYGASYYPFIKTTLSPLFDPATIALTQSGGELETKKLSDTVGSGADKKPIKEKYNSLYNDIKLQLSQQYIVLPPSATIAGIYASVDGSRGVWKAPANVGLSSVIEPTAKIDDLKQGNLNSDATTGKSINVIRSFTGKGVLVWGARTLEGNSAEWRYISVRRFFIMVEESVKKATMSFVFEPNDANTWTRVRAMIENYLTLLWRQGALAGAKPEQAFYVKIGLGQTMNADDIVNGKMIVEIGMAAVRPAEFIILRFSHKMQES